MAEDIFDYHAPSDVQLAVLQRLRASCKQHHELILRCLPPSRERSLAITKLEEVSMWENKAVVFSDVEDGH